MKHHFHDQSKTFAATAISQAIATLILCAPLLAIAQATTDLGSVVVTGKAADTPEPTKSAPSQGSLSARSAQSVVSDEYIRNYTPAASDYTQVLALSPGMFSYSPNGVGLGDSKITIRGLPDSYAVFSFDGIPFNDTNGVSHHSWVFFPTEMLGGAVVDRSPGTASTIGQASFVGSVDFQSRVLEPERRTSVTASYGSWATRLLGVEHETGQFGANGKSNLLVNVQDMHSDGYQTYNTQERQALSAKFQTALGDQTTLTLFGSYLNLINNTPSIKGVARSVYNAGGYDYLLSGNKSAPNYYEYNFYDVYTNFFYAGIKSTLGDGWKLDDKLYYYQYHNKQNYNGTTTINATSAVDKLNSYGTVGNLLKLSRESQLGTLRTGVWIDRADSNRYQIPTDPRTWIDVPAPNFSEHYFTTTLQPYAEYEFKIGSDLKVTPGVKYASYQQSYNHLQDNGGAVGTLGGTYNKTTGVITGGAPSIDNSVTYSDVLPSLDIHYMLQPDWSAYLQWSTGDEIPSTSVFDVANAKVSPDPKPTRAKTIQLGTVRNTDRFTFSADAYYTKLDGTYTALPPDTFGNVGYVLTGNQVSKGVEAEANVAIGWGFSTYVNATVGSLKYETGQWVAGAPRDTQTIALNYQRGPWAVNLSANRVGRNFNDAKDGTHQAFLIEPVVLTNLYANYTFLNPSSWSKQAKIQLAVNNVMDRHDVVAIASPVAGSNSANPLAGDLLTVTPGRSVSVTATIDF